MTEHTAPDSAPTAADAVDDPRAFLQEAVTGQDDGALVALAENLGGVEAFLDIAFQGMTQALDPAKAQDATVGWEITHEDDVHTYVLTIEGGTATAERTDPSGSRVTLRLSVPNYMRLIAGQLDGMQAFMSGQLQVKGDMMFAAQIQPMFGN